MLFLRVLSPTFQHTLISESNKNTPGFVRIDTKSFAQTFNRDASLTPHDDERSVFVSIKTTISQVAYPLTMFRNQSFVALSLTSTPASSVP